MIRYDLGNPSILVQCSECPGLAALRFGRREAYLVGANHEIEAHDRKPSEALAALRLWEQREARRAEKAKPSAP